ncbi:MAG: hypothetical protein HFJ48_01385 [Clostridia bacterium]|nr:hypothetical protein [Clostridia bacterium]
MLEDEYYKIKICDFCSKFNTNKCEKVMIEKTIIKDDEKQTIVSNCKNYERKEEKYNEIFISE